MSEIVIRPTAPEEWRRASAVVSTALMHAPADDEAWAKAEPSWVGTDSLSAWDGDTCVGHVAGYRFDTLVPGGARVPTNGVTRVGVLPTHRRRGIARRLLERLLGEARERGQVLASLRASETVIYPRYGFGLAGECAEAVLDPRAARPISGAATGSMRLVAPDGIIDAVSPIYERAATRPGVITRPDWMWKRYFENAIALGGDGEFVAVHTSTDGIDDGFVHYSVKWKEERYLLAHGVGEVYDLWGTDPSVELALWDYLCNVDLVQEWYAEERPVDDVIQFAVGDRRAHRLRSTWDEQWLRLLDVDAALGARAFADADGSFTVAVTDALLADNSGSWEISASGAKRIADGTADGAAADLVVTVTDLAAAYLGGTKWTALAGAGRIAVHDSRALARADALFAVPWAPFCCSGF
jgi:predicted acetyltransferase